jgi:hypothetical protein
MPALGASEDARGRAYGAGIHVLFVQSKTWMAPERGLARVPNY